MTRRFGLREHALAEQAYDDALQTIDRKPFPGVAGLKNIKRMMSRLNPSIEKVSVEEVVDMSFVEKLDKSGFIDGALRTGGLAP